MIIRLSSPLDFVYETRNQIQITGCLFTTDSSPFLPTENGVLYVVPFVHLFNNSSGFTLQSIFQSIKRSNQSTSSLFLFYESYGCLEFWKHIVDSEVSFIHVLLSLFYGDSIEFFFIFFSVV